MHPQQLRSQDVVLIPALSSATVSPSSGPTSPWTYSQSLCPGKSHLSMFFVLSAHRNRDSGSLSSGPNLTVPQPMHSVTILGAAVPHRGAPQRANHGKILGRVALAAVTTALHPRRQSHDPRTVTAVLSLPSLSCSRARSPPSSPSIMSWGIPSSQIVATMATAAALPISALALQFICDS